MRNQAQVLLKRSCTLWKLVNTQTRGITLLCIGKIIFVSVAFLMALSICCFKYSFHSHSLNVGHSIILLSQHMIYWFLSHSCAMGVHVSHVQMHRLARAFDARISNVLVLIKTQAKVEIDTCLYV